MTDQDQPPIDDELVAARTKQILDHAVAILSDEEYAERVEWCNQHQCHGIRMHPDPADNFLEFRWGGQTLAWVALDALTDTRPVHFDRIEGLPDTPEGLE